MVTIIVVLSGEIERLQDALTSACYHYSSKLINTKSKEAQLTYICESKAEEAFAGVMDSINVLNLELLSVEIIGMQIKS